MVSRADLTALYPRAPQADIDAFAAQSDALLAQFGIVATADRLQADFRREGHCYAPYEDTGYYGIALHSENFVKQLMTTGISARMQLVRFQARGWHGHQDVWSYRRM